MCPLVLHAGKGLKVGIVAQRQRHPAAPLIGARWRMLQSCGTWRASNG
jgi:hypothetical protein